eukprot:6477315-Amphidinium_carterae.1
MVLLSFSSKLQVVFSISPLLPYASVKGLGAASGGVWRSQRSGLVICENPPAWDRPPHPQISKLSQE